MSFLLARGIFPFTLCVHPCMLGPRPPSLPPSPVLNLIPSPLTDGLRTRERYLSSAGYFRLIRALHFLIFYFEKARGRPRVTWLCSSLLRLKSSVGRFLDLYILSIDTVCTWRKLPLKHPSCSKSPQPPLLEYPKGTGDAMT